MLPKRPGQPRFRALGAAVRYAPGLVVPVLVSVFKMMVAAFSGLFWLEFVCSSERNWLTAWLRPLSVLLPLEAVAEFPLSLEELAWWWW